MREELGNSLVLYGSQNNDVVILDADVSNSTMTKLFNDAYPERFFNVGIAEPGMIDVAVGLALGGKLPFVSAFAGIISNRALEQIRTCIALNNVNVKILAGYAGLSDYKDGSTHHSIFDIAVMRAMPNMTVVVPAYGKELEELIPLIGDHEGPVYLRISRENPKNSIKSEQKLKIGKGRIVKEGKEVTIIATGIPLHRCLQAATLLDGEGISAKVLELHTIKPVDEELILACAEMTGAIVTVEEHSIIGGLYGAVSECLSRTKPTPIVPIGIQDSFMPTSLCYDSLLDFAGLRPSDIAAAVRAAIMRKA